MSERGFKLRGERLSRRSMLNKASGIHCRHAGIESRSKKERKRERNRTPREDGGARRRIGERRFISLSFTRLEETVIRISKMRKRGFLKLIQGRLKTAMRAGLVS